MKTWPVVAVVTALLFLVPNDAVSCSCARLSFEEHYKEADAIFSGLVTKITPTHNAMSRRTQELISLMTGQDVDLQIYDLVVEFKVIETFKGVVSAKPIEIITADPKACCICGDRRQLYFPLNDNHFSSRLVDESTSVT